MDDCCNELLSISSEQDMKILLHLAHPAHFHLFKNLVVPLKSLGHHVRFSYNDKDVLSLLINNFNSPELFYKIEARKNLNGKLDLYKQFIEKNINFFHLVKAFRPDIILGTSIIISLVGKILGIPNIIVNEDDFDIIRQTSNIGYKFATKIVCPNVCRTGKWESKCIKYDGYHELAYLSPKYFQPDVQVLQKYGLLAKEYTIIRFAKLLAHHDDDIHGIDDNFAAKIIEEVKHSSQVFITSERNIPESLAKYLLKIDPLDIHHIMAFAKLYIGDSQTMAAESGVLGVPFIRYNGFVGRISYLEELENKYKLGFGVRPNDQENVLEIARFILSDNKTSEVWRERQELMLNEKVDLTQFLVDLIENRGLYIEK